MATTTFNPRGPAPAKYGVCHDGPTDCSHGLSTQKFLVPAGGTDRLNAETPHAVPTSPLAECNDQNGYHLPPKTANLVILRPNHACVCEVSEANVAQLTLSRSERSDRSAGGRKLRQEARESLSEPRKTTFPRV